LALCLIAREFQRLWAWFFPPSFSEPRGKRMPVFGFIGIALVLALPAADTMRDAYRYGIFHTDALEGAWRIKGGFGFVRVGGHRVRFDTQVDGRTLKLSNLGGLASPTLL
jgi:hypothetical protein